jgi:hypothetical protein
MLGVIDARPETFAHDEYRERESINGVGAELLVTTTS